MTSHLVTDDKTPGIESTWPSAGAEAFADEEARSAEGGGAVERGGGVNKLSEDNSRLILNALEAKIPSEINFCFLIIG